MQLVQNIKQKSMPRNAMILFAPITIGTVVAADALAAGRGGGGGHIGAAFGGGHTGGGFVSGRTAGDHLGGPGGNFHGTRMGDGSQDGHHRFREHFGAGLYSYIPGYGDYGYDDYGYDGLGDYAGDTACFQYRHVYTAAGWQRRQVWACN